MTGTVIIPARGGSKRVPRKNVRLVGGVPVIGHTIRAVLDSGIAGSVVVTTDDGEIAQVAQQFGARTLDRPLHLADDHTPVLPVMQDAILQLMASDVITDPGELVAMVMATAITMDPRDLVESMELVGSSDFLVSVTAFEHPPQRGFTLTAEGHLNPVDPPALNARTQDLPDWYHDAAQFVWGRAATWLSASSILGTARGYRVPRWRSVDIDTPEDLLRAEVLLTALASVSSEERDDPQQ